LIPILLGILFLAAGILAPGTPAEAGEILSVPYVKALLNVPAVLEIRLGLLEKEFGPEGTEVRHPEIDAGPLQVQALASGSIQEANSLGATLLLPAAASGLNLRIIGVNARAPRAYALLVRDPAIRSIRDLAGRKVAGPRGTFLHQLLWSALRREKMPPDGVGLLSMPQPEALTALLSGKVDGALLAGPLVPRAEKRGARVLLDGGGRIGGVSYLVTTEGLLKKHPDWADRLLKVRRRAVAHMKAHPEESLRAASEESGLPVGEIAAQMKEYDFSPDLRASDRRDLEEVRDFLAESGLLEKSVDPAILLGKP
jgi:sulfonate transport system substrate-binding protein